MSPEPRGQSPEPGAGRKPRAMSLAGLPAGFRLWAGFGLWTLGSGLVACFPTTTRPPFTAVPAAPTFEIELQVPQATRALALAFDADSLPVRRTEPKDGWLETEWFDAKTLHATTRRVVGPDVVKVRAFVDPSRPNHSNITIETVYRPLADPSRSDRELEVQVPANNMILARIVVLATKLARQYGGAATDTIASAPVVKKP